MRFVLTEGRANEIDQSTGARGLLLYPEQARKKRLRP